MIFAVAVTRLGDDLYEVMTALVEAADLAEATGIAQRFADACVERTPDQEVRVLVSDMQIKPEVIDRGGYRARVAGAL